MSSALDDLLAQYESSGSAPATNTLPAIANQKIPDQQTSDTPTAKILDYVSNNLGKLSTREIPGTEGGNLGCAAAVCKVFKNATGEELTPGGTLSTGEEWNHLSKDPRFQMLPVHQAQPGDIIVTATGANTRHGHTGYVLDNGDIASNSSATGKLERNYTLDSWMNRVAPRNPQQTAVFRYVGNQQPMNPMDALLKQYGVQGTNAMALPALSGLVTQQ